MFSVPLAAGGAGIPPVSAVNPENVSLHVGVASEQFQTNATRKFILRKRRCFKLWIVMMLLEFVSLKKSTKIHKCNNSVKGKTCSR